MHLHGIHHVTAISAQIARNAAFYTGVLGLRLVKKSVNQDDVSAYHLFYADKVGSPGTDMTFFDWPQISPEQRGSDSIVATAFRVNGAAALAYWAERLAQHNVKTEGSEHFAGRGVLRFEDPEGQRLLLVDDGGAPFEGEWWEGAGIPQGYALRGFYAVTLAVPRLRLVDPILTQILQWTPGERAPYPGGGEAIIYSMDGGGPGREVWVLDVPTLPPAYPGAGGVHHVAFRVADETEQIAWLQRIRRVGLPISDLIDRYYFQSIYFRISNGILFEIATDGPGFATDEAPEVLGQKLALPPFLEPRRQQIEARLKPLPTP